MKKVLLAGVTLVAIGAVVPASAQQATSPSNANNRAAVQQNAAPAQQSTNGVQQNANAAQPSRDEIMQAQKALDQKGFNVGKPDGILGPETKAALSKFQQQQKLQQTGQLDNATLSALGVNAPATTGQSNGQPKGNMQQPK